MPPPGDLPDPGIESGSLMPPALAGQFFTTSATWEAWIYLHIHIKCTVGFNYLDFYCNLY